MLFILFLIAWLIAPVAELAIIIVLLVQNGEYKKKIQELSKAGQRAVLARSMYQREYTDIAAPVDNTGEEGSSSTPRKDGEEQALQKVLANAAGSNPEDGKMPRTVQISQEPQPAEAAQEPSKPQTVYGPQEVRTVQEPQGPQTAQEPQEAQTAQEPQTPAACNRPFNGAAMQKTAADNSMATAALIIGVVLVVLAGIIFATTSWRLLPSLFKALLVLALSGIFFGASILAEKKLHIHKTGNAFYILSSIFLFLSVLAAAYFRILGPSFILEGNNRWWVLWIGSLLTIAMLFLGIRRFCDKTYTQACFWGMTISMTFLLSACQAKWGQCVSAMTFYAFLLVLGEQKISQKLQKAQETQEAQEAQEAQEVSSGLETDSAGRELVTALLADGFHGFAPVHFWIFAVLQVIYGFFASFYLFSIRPGWYVAPALAAAAAGSALQARQEKNSWAKGFFSLSAASCIHCAVAWGYFTFFAGEKRGVIQLFADTDILWAILLAEFLTALCLLLGAKKQFRLRTCSGDGIYTAFLVTDALILQFNAMLRSQAVLCHLAFLAGTLPLLAAALLWKKRFPVIKRLLPLLFWYMLLPIHGAIDCGQESLHGQIWTGFFQWVDRGFMEFGLLTVLMVWSRRKKMGFGPALFFIGSVAQIVYFSEHEISFPFFLLLSLYLAGTESPFRYKAGALCSMVGFFVLACPFTQDNKVLRGLLIACVYWLWLYVDTKFRNLYVPGSPETVSGQASGPDTGAGLQTAFPTDTGKQDVFWDIAGCAVMAYIMFAFYSGSHLKVWNLPLCMAAYAAFYLKFYLGKQIWPHLFITFLMIPVPEVLLLRYRWSDNLLYTAVGVSYLVTGIISRYRCQILERDEHVIGGWRIDWYHAMAFVVLVPMAFFDDDGIWRFLYLLLTAIYFLQYGAVRPLKRLAWSGAAATMVLAFWNQPFLQWPDIIKTEIFLLPAAAFIWGMGYIWREEDSQTATGRTQIIRDTQTIGYVLLLLVLCLNAWAKASVINALILEVICLSLFFWAQVTKNRRWVRISGSIIVVISLYMTKGFWLSISWWVYLLAAGIGLIVFAAVNEKKKH